MTKRWVLNLLFMALGAFTLILVLNFTGFGLALAKHERVRVILPPQAAAHHHHGARQAKATPATHTAAPTVAVPAPVPQRVQVDVQVDVNVNTRGIQPSVPVAVPSYHEGVICYRYQGCTHYWVPQQVPSVSTLPYCAPGYIGRTCRYVE